MNRIVFELSPEDRARLDAIIAGLDKLQPHCDSCVDNVLHVVEEAIVPAATVAPAAAAAPAVDPDPAPFETTPAVEPPSLADFQKAVALRCAENPAVKPKVRELVNRYAASVSEIPEEKRLEFLDLMAKL